MADADAPTFPPGDYVSPGFARVRPDAAFPNLSIVPDLGVVTWPFLRRDIPHNFYADRRLPSIGFLNRDEAHVLYNTALACRGGKALEIGCWMGWSACHIALAGLELDVIDPLLGDPTVLASVTASLQAAGVRDRVTLLAGRSPAAAQALHAAGRGSWRLVFIDGNHDRPGPLQDAQAVHLLAAPDALVIFHDLASPEVAEGLDYLRAQGWHTMLYQTTQIMGAAWRGAARPVAHVPDPAVAWTLPAHLHRHPVSGAA